MLLSSNIKSQFFKNQSNNAKYEKPVSAIKYGPSVLSSLASDPNTEDNKLIEDKTDSNNNVMDTSTSNNQI